MAGACPLVRFSEGWIGSQLDRDTSRYSKICHVFHHPANKITKKVPNRAHHWRHHECTSCSIAVLFNDVGFRFLIGLDLNGTTKLMELTGICIITSSKRQVGDDDNSMTRFDPRNFDLALGALTDLAPAVYDEL